MPTIDRIQGFADELTAIRHDLHAHPEIGFEEVRTSGIVAEKLAAKDQVENASVCAPTWTRYRCRKTPI